jgi:tRNA-specific 2-thiouridylase
MTKVYVGMSGGVDSSLTAALLVEQGYDVTGVYMKNWTQDLPGVKCPWADDLADAKRVAVQLGIDFKVFDFENEYRHKVVDYMIEEYKAGRTPNPDIMCNQEVKFKLFLEAALEDGADMIATGHYAKVFHRSDPSLLPPVSVADAPTESGRQKGGSSGESQPSAASSLSSRSTTTVSKHLQPELEATPGPEFEPGAKPFTNGNSGRGDQDRALLKMAHDTNKDQTYFLYRVTGEALAHTLFPLGEYDKPTVRKMAEQRGLFTAAKKDSQGICFVGKVGIREFLGQYVEQKPGEIIDKQSGKVLGHHDGAIFYTLGQRHGLDLGGGLPYYVVGKDMDKNEVYVTTDLNDETLWKTDVRLASMHWINDAPTPGVYQVRVRHRAPLISAQLSFEGDDVILKLDDQQRAIAAGQSVVIYDGDVCLGGGIVL